MNAPTLCRVGGRRRRGREARRAAVGQLELNLWPRPPTQAPARSLRPNPASCEHQPGQPRRVTSAAAAVVRCRHCAVVLERLGAVDLVEVGLELAALPLDRRAA